MTKILSKIIFLRKYTCQIFNMDHKIIVTHIYIYVHYSWFYDHDMQILTHLTIYITKALWKQTDCKRSSMQKWERKYNSKDIYLIQMWIFSPWEFSWRNHFSVKKMANFIILSIQLAINLFNGLSHQLKKKKKTYCSKCLIQVIFFRCQRCLEWSMWEEQESKRFFNNKAISL